jgi:toluene monooxygenase system protein B
MALLPLQGLFLGDFVLVVAPVDDQDPMSTVAQKVAYHVVGKRVAEQDRPMQVRFNDEIVAEDATPATLGMLPMDFVEVSYR